MIGQERRCARCFQPVEVEGALVCATCQAKKIANAAVGKPGPNVVSLAENKSARRNYGPRNRLTKEYRHNAYVAATHRAKTRLAKEQVQQYRALLEQELRKSGLV